jgi:hypothetical protein
MPYYCLQCGKEIPLKRAKLGYTETCVDHSESKRYSGFIIEEDKECYEIHVVKDHEIAEQLQKLNKLY